MLLIWLSVNFNMVATNVTSHARLYGPRFVGDLDAFCEAWVFEQYLDWVRRR